MIHPQHALVKAKRVSLLLTLAVFSAVQLGVDSAVRAADVNLVSNGSFELGSDPGVSTTIDSPNSSTITDWTIESGDIDYIGSRWVAGLGNRCLDLSGTTAGTITQVLSGLTTGQSYRVSFLLAGNPEIIPPLPAVKQLRVTTGSITQDFAFNASGHTPGNLGWQRQSLVFIALEPSLTLAFTSLTAGSGGPAVDDVTVTTSDVPPPPPPPALIVRGPYLQSATPSNIVVRWRTDVATDSRVRFGLSADDLASGVADAALTPEHSVTLAGLAADTKYFYAIGSGTNTLAAGEDYFFVTPPASAKSTRIWAIGDCGTASFGSVAPLEVRDAYYAFTESRSTDVWLMLGDNAYFSGTDNEYQAAVFNVYHELLRTTPVWPTIGNHETYAADPDGHIAYYDIFSLPQDGRAGGVASGTERYYSFDYGSIHFVCLDSEISDKSPDGPMLTWLEQDLAANTKDWLIAYWHSPPYSKGSHDSDLEINLIQMRDSAVPILEAHGVDLVLCGHSHSYERSFFLNGHYGSSGTLSASMIKDDGSGRPDDTGAYLKSPGSSQAGAVYVVAGSAGQTSGGSLNHPAMYIALNRLGSMVIDVESNRLEAKFLRESGEVDDHFTILKGNVGPSIVSGPANRAAFVGGTATFSVVVNGTPPLSYQWLFNGSPIEGATDPSLILSNLEVSDAGEYSVIVSNLVGAVTSSSATLTVSETPPGPVIVNGSFELGTDPGVSTTIDAPNSSSITGWIIENGDIDYIGSRWVAGDGDRCIDLSGVVAGTILQSIDGLTVGQTYRLSFLMAANPEAPPPSTDLLIEVGSTSNRFSVTTVGTTSDLRWSSKTLDFTATSQTNTLRFVSLNPGWAGPVLDAISLTTLPTPPPPTNNLVVNGSFELGTDPGVSTTIDAPNSSSITGWTIESGNIDYIGSRWVAGDGHRCIDLSGAVAGTILQNINGLTVGQTYRLSFLMAANPEAPPPSTDLLVQMGGASNRFSVTTVGTVTDLRWTLQTMDFMAASETTPLRFVSLNPGWAGPVLDNVTIAPSSPPPPQCTPVPSGLIAWWRGEGNADDATGLHDGTLLFGASFETGRVGQAFSFDGGRARVSVPDADVFKLTGSLSIEGWVRADAVAPGIIFIRGDNRPGLDAYALGLNEAGQFQFQFNTPDNASVLVPTPVTPAIGEWMHVAAVLNDATGDIHVYVDGSVVAHTNTTLRPIRDLDPGSEPAVGIGNHGGTFHHFPFHGLVDELALYSRALSQEEIRAIHTAGAAGKCLDTVSNQPPIIVAQPQSQSVEVEATARFDVVTRGTAPFTYQWYFDGQPLADSNDAQFVIESVQTSHAGEYFVVVANAFGSVTSQVALLNVQITRTLAVSSPGLHQEGSSITVPIELISEGDVGGMTFVLQYDPNFLRDPELAWSEFLGSLFTTVNTSMPGEIRATFALSGTPVRAGTQLVASVTFLLRSVPEDLETGLDLEVSDASTPSGDPLDGGNRSRDAVVRIARRVFLGDNNANQRLDVGDATVILRFLTQLETTRPWDVTGNDLNQNRSLDSGDAVKVLRAAAAIDPQPGGSGDEGGGALPLAGALRPAAAGDSPALESAMLMSVAQQGTPGGTFSVQVRLQDVLTPIAGAAITLEYPTDAVRLISAQSHRLGALVPVNALAVWNVGPAQNNYPSQNGRVSLAVSSAAPWPSSNGVLAELTFQVQPGVSDRFLWPLHLRSCEVTANGFRNRHLISRGSVIFGRDPRPGFLTDIRRDQGGPFRFTLNGAAGVRYTIEASSNLIDWSPIDTIMNDPGVIDFEDLASTGLPQRFYRVHPETP